VIERISLGSEIVHGLISIHFPTIVRFEIQRKFNISYLIISSGVFLCKLLSVFLCTLDDISS
jgi:hypothetical protein